MSESRLMPNSAEPLRPIEPLSEFHKDIKTDDLVESISNDSDMEQHISTEGVQLPHKDWRFWAIFPPLCLSQFLIALEVSIPTAALPKISSDLDAGDSWVWVVNAYLLTK